MQKELSEQNDLEVIREEIQAIKDHINLIEAILDINELRKSSFVSADNNQTTKEIDYNV